MSEEKKKQPKSFRYRKFYEDKTGLKVPKDFEVHHIDRDRENNDIKNLVAIPKKLHQTYHSRYPTLPYYQDAEWLFQMKGSTEKGNLVFNYIMGELEDFFPVYHQCKVWIDYREYLLGRIPNIHKLSYDKKGGEV